MSLSVASDILRRLQNSLYAFRPAEGEMEGPATTGDSDDDLSPSAPVEFGPIPSEGFLPPSSSSYTSQPVTSSSTSLESVPPYLGESGNSRPEPPPTRRRQSSISTNSSPDVSAQVLLRRRILEIQGLNVPEKEKARRIQVLLHALIHLICRN
jgi:hypothetical protein